MKIAVLGYKGFVGSAIYKHFIASGKYEVVGIGRGEYASLIGQHFDVFINANGNSKKLLAAKEPKLDFEMNVLTTLNTLLDFKIDKYVYISSVDVYNDVSNPANNHEDVAIQPERLSNYGFDKYLGELLVKKYAKNWLILRLGGMVGENMKKNAIYDLVNLRKLFVHEESEYQYINTADVAKITENLLSDRINHQILNICGDGTVSLKSIAAYFHIELSDTGKEKQKYNISVEKLHSMLERVPTSWETVVDFIKSARPTV